VAIAKSSKTTQQQQTLIATELLATLATTQVCWAWAKDAAWTAYRYIRNDGGLVVLLGTLLWWGEWRLVFCWQQPLAIVGTWCYWWPQTVTEQCYKPMITSGVETLMSLVASSNMSRTAPVMMIRCARNDTAGWRWWLMAILIHAVVGQRCRLMGIDDLQATTTPAQPMGTLALLLAVLMGVMPWLMTCLLAPPALLLNWLIERWLFWWWLPYDATVNGLLIGKLLMINWCLQYGII